jgi:serine/threonine-protein kinase RsbW
VVQAIGSPDTALSGKNTVHLELSSNHELTDLVQAVSDELSGKLGFTDDEGHWIGMAIREAVNNAIKHGNRQDPAKKVMVSFHYDLDALTVSVQDEGEGFDVTNVPDPLLPENLLKTSGRGVFYIRSFMDSVEFYGSRGRGTEVRMIKRRRPA